MFRKPYGDRVETTNECPSQPARTGATIGWPGAGAPHRVHTLRDCVSSCSEERECTSSSVFTWTAYNHAPRKPPLGRRPWGHEVCSRSLRRRSDCLRQKRIPAHRPSLISGSFGKRPRHSDSSTARSKSIQSTSRALCLDGASSGTRLDGTGPFRTVPRHALPTWQLWRCLPGIAFPLVLDSASSVYRRRSRTASCRGTDNSPSFPRTPPCARETHYA